MRPIPVTLFSAACLTTLFPSGGRAADTAGDQPADSELRKLVDASVGWFTVHGGPKGETTLKAVPVLRWGNQERGSETGLTVLYVAEGRPHAVACVYPWEGQLIQEFSSLSEGPVRAELKGSEVWDCRSAGVEFKPIPDGGKPAASPEGRLLQMKKLVRRFDATLVGWKNDDSDRQELRLLTRPAFRYEPPAGVLTDGAVFAFAMGTDPEVLLMIETLDGAWRYAFVRRTSGELQGRLDDAVVWTAERFPDTDRPDGANRSIKWQLDELVGTSERKP